jgi:hypothetical protein
MSGLLPALKSEPFSCKVDKDLVMFSDENFIVKKNLGMTQDY